jgi:hypothetical protein
MDREIDIILLCINLMHIEQRMHKILIRKLDKMRKEEPLQWCLHLIMARFVYANDPESYTSSSIATGRASLPGQIEG